MVLRNQIYTGNYNNCLSHPNSNISNITRIQLHCSAAWASTGGGGEGTMSVPQATLRYMIHRLTVTAVTCFPHFRTFTRELPIPFVGYLVGRMAWRHAIMNFRGFV